MGALPEALDHSEEGARLVLLCSVLTQNESLASAEDHQAADFGDGALELEGDLLGLLGLLSEDGLSLAAEARLLSLIAARSLGDLGVLALLVLTNLHIPVFLALGAERVHSLGSVHHD